MLANKVDPRTTQEPCVTSSSGALIIVYLSYFYKWMKIGCSITITKHINTQSIFLAGALNIWLPSYTCYCSHLRFIASLYVLLLSYIVYCYPILLNASLYVLLHSYIVYCYPMRFPVLLNHLLKEEGLAQKFPAIFFFIRHDKPFNALFYIWLLSHAFYCSSISFIALLYCYLFF